MNLYEKVELVELLEERTLSDFERRKRRMRAAEARLWGVDDKGQPKLSGLADLLAKARNEKPLTRDEYIVVNGGFRPGDDPEGEWSRHMARMAKRENGNIV